MGLAGKQVFKFGNDEDYNLSTDSLVIFIDLSSRSILEGAFP